MKGLGRSVALAAVAAALLVGGDANAQSQNLWDKINSTGTLTCGAMAANPLGSWKVDGPDQYDGYSIRFCRLIARDLGKALGKTIKLEFNETSFATVVLDLQSGKIDLWAGMSATEERKKALDMTDAMYDLAHCVVMRKGITGLKKWSDIDKPEIKISSVTGTSDEKALDELAPKATKLSFKENAAAILAVQSARADGTITSVLSCLRILKESPEVFGEVVFPEPIRSLPSAAGVRKDGDGRFFKFVDDWAKKARTDGTTTEVFKTVIALQGLNPGALPAGFKF